MKYSLAGEIVQQLIPGSSSRMPGYDSQHPHGSSWLSVTPVPGGSPQPPGTCVERLAHRQNTHTHTVEWKLKIFAGWRWHPPLTPAWSALPTESDSQRYTEKLFRKQNNIPHKKKKEKEKKIKGLVPLARKVDLLRYVFNFLIFFQVLKTIYQTFPVFFAFFLLFLCPPTHLDSLSLTQPTFSWTTWV